MQRKVILSFKDELDNTFNFIVNDVKDDASESEFVAIMDNIIATEVVVGKLGSLVSKVSATVVETTDTKYDLSK